MTQLLVLTQSDFLSPILPTITYVNSCFILYIDNFSKVAVVYFMRNKSIIEMMGEFQEFKSSMKNSFLDSQITRFRCDNRWREYLQRLFQDVLSMLSIRFELFPPYTLCKNEVSEKMIHNLTTRADVMMLDACMEDQFGAYSYTYAQVPVCG